MKLWTGPKTFFVVVSLTMASALVVSSTGCSTYNRTHETSEEAAEDDSITSRVTAALTDTGGYKFSDVHVHTFKRRVQLSGFVDTDHHKDQAGIVAQQVDGVRTVINNITVK
jgi:osmotically-inducible protein OsmY